MSAEPIIYTYTQDTNGEVKLGQKKMTVEEAQAFDGDTGLQNSLVMHKGQSIHIFGAEQDADPSAGRYYFSIDGGALKVYGRTQKFLVAFAPDAWGTLRPLGDSFELTDPSVR